MDNLHKTIFYGLYETVIHFLLFASYLTLQIKESQLAHVLLVVLATLMNVTINEKLLIAALHVA